MPRRPIQMKPIGNMHGIFRSKRVPSSTCPKPVISQEGTIGGEADMYALEADTRWSGAEKHVIEMATTSDIPYEVAEQAMLEIWNG